MSNSLTVSGNLHHTQGTLNTNGQTCQCNIYDSSNSNTRALTLGASTVTITAGGSSTVWNLGTSSGMAMSAASSTIILNGAATTGASFTGGGLTYGTVNLTGSGPWVMAGVNTFANLTRTGTAVKTDSLQLNGSQTVTGTLTLGGNTTQGVNRLLVFSSTAGTARTFTMTGAAVVINGDVDFEDISISGTPSWTNAGSAFVGNALGNNSLITTNATTPANQTRTGAGGNWSTLANWTSRVPLPQDDAIFTNGSSGTIVLDMPRGCQNLTCNSGFTGTLTRSGTNNTVVYGNLTFVSGMFMTQNPAMTVSGRSSFTITTVGLVTGSLTISAPSGTYTLQDDFTSGAIVHNALGTFNDGGHTVTLNGASGSTNYANINTLSNSLIISGQWNLGSIGNGAAGIWRLINTSCTFTSTGSTISLTDTSATNKTFNGGGFTYGNLSISGGGAGSITFTGANTFATLPQITGGTKSIVWPGSTTTTFTAGGSFGNGTNVITMTASAGSATLSFGSQVNANFLNLTNIPAAGTTPAYAGASSTDGGGNTNWVFTAAPTGTVSSSTALLLGVG